MASIPAGGNGTRAAANSAVRLSDNQIAGYARSAGFPESEILTAVAIAKAESGGNPRAHNSTPPDTSYGLWQINMIGALGPNRRKQLGLSSNDQLFDPATNARAAKRIWSDANGWTPWSTYKPGMAGDNDGNSDSNTASGDGTRDGLFGIQGAIDRSVENIRQGIIASLIFLLAIALIILGATILNRHRAMAGIKFGINALGTATKVGTAVKKAKNVASEIAT